MSRKIFIPLMPYNPFKPDLKTKLQKIVFTLTPNILFILVKIASEPAGLPGP